MIRGKIKELAMINPTGERAHAFPAEMIIRMDLGWNYNPDGVVVATDADVASDVHRKRRAG